MQIDERLGTRVILENDRVRVWEHRVGPQQTGHHHVHRRPYLSVVIRGAGGETVDARGEVLAQFDLGAGDAYWYGEQDLPETHALRNTGDGEIVIVTTELLEQPTAAR